MCQLQNLHAEMWEPHWICHVQIPLNNLDLATLSAIWLSNDSQIEELGPVYTKRRLENECCEARG